MKLNPQTVRDAALGAIIAMASVAARLWLIWSVAKFL